MLTALLLLFACDSPDLPDVVPESGTRTTITEIHFDRWVDYLVLDAAVSDDCEWLYPLYDDNSTPYPPLQVYWVIYEEANDVTDGDYFADTYFLGDEVSADNFDDKFGLSPQGFQFPTALQSSFLNVDYTEFSADGRTMEAGLAKPIGAALRVTSTPEDDGSCSFEVRHCTAETCDKDTDWSPLTWMFMELGFLFTVQSKEFHDTAPPR